MEKERSTIATAPIRNDNAVPMAAEELDWQLHLLLQKNAGEDAWKGKMQFSHSAAVIKGLAIMIQQCASDLDAPVGNVVARLATILLQPGENQETDHHSGGADSQ